MLVSLKQLVADAQKGGYALGAFNTQNLETTLGIIRAAVDTHSPVVIQVSETTINYAGVKPITHIVQTIAKNAAVDVPVALHLDHGKRFWSIAECIHAGFTSIMISASELPFDENLALTKQTVAYAHERGVWAQGELGQVRASDDFLATTHQEEYLTDPTVVKRFVKETGVDTLAVAVGNVWGVSKLTKGAPEIDEKRLREIHSEVPSMPLVLHGASGLPKEQIDLAKHYGVRIINIDTELRWVFTERLRATLKDHPDLYDPRDVLEPSIVAVQSLVKEKLQMFGSAGEHNNTTMKPTPRKRKALPPPRKGFVWNWRMLVLGILLNAATVAMVVYTISLLNDYRACTQNAAAAATLFPENTESTSLTNTSTGTENDIPDTETDNSGVDITP